MTKRLYANKNIAELAVKILALRVIVTRKAFYSGGIRHRPFGLGDFEAAICKI